MGHRHLIAVIHYVQYKELPYALHDITHKIQRPCRIGLGGLFQRRLDPCRKAFLQTDTFLVVHILVYTVNLLVVLPLSFTPETFEYLPETVSVLRCRPYRFFHFSVISLLLIIVIRTVDLHQLARPSDAQFVFLYNLYRYPLLYLGLYSFFQSYSSISGCPMQGLRTFDLASGSLPKFLQSLDLAYIHATAF